VKVYVLFGQRACRYEGEYAPEALAVADEWTDEDNPEYMQEQLATQQASKEFTHLRVIAMEIDGAKLVSLLAPQAPVLPAEITG
jgi:hypothetical protein